MDKRVKHGMYGTRIYRIWAAMKRRCLNPNYHEYHLYGGRGIKVCNEWLGFVEFYKWAMNNGYKDDLSIDRINQDGNYEPNNCRWETCKRQANNRRSNLTIEYQGQTKPLKQWAEDLGLNYKMLYKRFKLGWEPEDAFNIPSGDAK